MKMKEQDASNIDLMNIIKNGFRESGFFRHSFLLFLYVHFYRLDQNKSGNDGFSVERPYVTSGVDIVSRDFIWNVVDIQRRLYGQCIRFKIGS